ncbi:MAG: glycosyltransferase [Bacteroidetes bacterium]|nr:glycosyltransferase [Bacteroidota bacterium]
MLSILIPTYNYNFSNLVYELHKQLTVEEILFEIIVFDDFSEVNYSENNEVKFLKNVSVNYLVKNVGRSIIRNLLAEKANYDWLLFLDCDTIPVNPSFIKKYIQELKSDQRLNVICGGVNYKPDEPELSYYLRWNFGRQREQQFYADRIRKPYNSFFSSNFLIHKNIFNQIKFNSSISLYGYEDVVFASDLKKKEIIITHIDNPVYHIGIEDNFEFLNKTKIAIKNLIELNDKNLLTKKEVKLLYSFEAIRKFYINILLRDMYPLLGKKIEFYIINKKSKLFMFDLFKISYLSFIYKR